MSSPHKPLPKPSRVAKMSVRPVRRKKLNYCNRSNEVDVNLPKPMPKPQSPLKESSQENPPTTLSNHDSLQPHSFPFGDSCDTNVGQAFIPPQSVNQTQLTQPLFPHLLINLHVASVLHAQTPPSPYGDNQTQPPLPPSPTREMLINDINQLQDLSNLLAMHLSQRNTPSLPYSLNLAHTLNLNQVEHHVGYCPNKNINVVNKKKRLLQLLQHALNDDKPDAYYYEMEVDEQKQWKLESEREARLDAARKQREEHWKELESI
ncbi:hypothetical protein Tco_0770824 [Tanacetum coccineum]|uniref:Uncharacterized protein n=1 Tax=Tanacetum coccineum TaxID=301880 RepID=A0ABQ4ZH13_9ASTR